MLLLSLAAGWTAGLAWGLWARPELAAGLLLSALALLALLLSPDRRLRWASLAALGAGLAVLRIAAIPFLPPVLPALAGQGPTEFLGVVVGDPEERERGYRLRLEVEEVAGRRLQPPEAILAWVHAPRDLVRARPLPYFRRGDRLLLSGALQRPPIFEGFDYPDYLARQGIRVVSFYPEVELVGEGEETPPLRLLSTIRARLSWALAEALPEPQAGLSQAVLLGERGSLEPGLLQAFSRTGTTHLLAISGLNIGIVLVLLLGASSLFLGRRGYGYLLLPLLGTWAYALLGGFEAPVQRAAVMGTFYLAGLALGRPQSGSISLALSAVLLTLVDPTALQSVSFQLSFLAMLGLFSLTPLLEPPLARLLGGEGASSWRGFLRTGVAASLGATLATWPLVAFNFHVVSLVGVPATLLALPALPVMIVAAFLTAVAGSLFEPLGVAVGWAAWPWTAYTVGVVRLFDVAPFAAWRPEALAPGLVWAYYGALLLFLAALPRRLLGAPFPADRGSWISALALPALLLANGVVWWMVASPPTARLTVAFLDVGQGDAILVQTPGGRRVLVDGGPSGPALARHLGRELPFWDRRIDLLVATHTDGDHLEGLVEAVERHPVGHVLASSASSESSTYAQWARALEERRVPATVARAGQRVELGEGGVLEVLHPPARPLLDTGADRNNNAVVLRLTYGRVSFLLASDVEALAEAYLVRESTFLGATVLKAPHHGSHTSSTTPFLEAVNPLVALVSVGQDNPFGHPDPEVVRRLEEHVGGRLFLTSRDGTVRVRTDGERLWVERER